MDASDILSSSVGYSTRDALQALHSELNIVSDDYYAQQNQRGRAWNQLLFFRHNNTRSIYHWTSIVLVFVAAVCSLAAYGFTYDTRNAEIFKDPWWIVESLVLLATLIINCYFVGWNHWMMENEHMLIMKQALEKLHKCIKNNTWNASNYPQLNSPLSPCVSLQWTLRDGEVVNLPVVLLVKGDIILLRPGQKIPASCRSLEDLNESQDVFLSPGDVYQPGIDSTTGINPQAREQLAPKKYLILETPFANTIKLFVSYQNVPPVSVFDNQRHRVCSVWLERRILPAIMVISLLTNIIRYIYLQGYVGHWAQMILILQVHVAVPLLPMVFPIYWQLLNYYGQARIFAAFEVGKQSKNLASDSSFDSGSTISVDEARVDLDWRRVLNWFYQIAIGQAPVATRVTNIMHVLGSATSLCCTDKKGILSWPNPSAEKVFFLTPSSSDDLNQGEGSQESHGQGPEKYVDANKAESSTRSYRKMIRRKDAFHSECRAEVLDLTHDAKSAFGLQFDDPSWQTRIASLKPMGLTVLANTCNLETVEWYTQFTDHVACAALQKKETVAVVNRRCLCELAKQIGFSNQALDIFSLEHTLGMYRQVPAEQAARERMHRARSFIPHKIPMPYMMSVVIKEKNSGTCQLMSQGSADILLDCCSDYWNGSDLCPLTDLDRKKVLDFYHRSSMTAYCTAFSYRPMSQNLSSNLNDVYIELPASNLHPSTTNLLGSDDNRYHNMWTSSRSFSVDSLIRDDSTAWIDDVSGCAQAQSNQILIGMATMQYQARQDFVQLIDKLEMACIRFVHFSNENELRSRVFSEKMGLEAGWNCHISLMSKSVHKCDDLPSQSPDESGHLASRFSNHQSMDSLRQNSSSLAIRLRQSHESMPARSYSAPSVINVENSQVKFQTNSQKEMSTRHEIIYRSGSRSPDSERTAESVDEATRLIDNQEDEGISNEPEDRNLALDPMSESRHTSSCITDNTEDSMTGGLDNRAKLPRGIENIRPHLENVDNVPLLVSLFTDCSPKSTVEMMKIMQDYGEVVLCLGSSLNIDNTAIFLTADCSLAIEPLYPQVCARQPVMLDPWDDDQPSPAQIASSLLSVPCPLFFRRDDNVSLIQLIAESRNHIMSMQNCLTVMLCCQLCIALIQVLAGLFLLPPVLASRHLMWLVFVCIPLLSLTMMGNPVDPRIMSQATCKNSDYIPIHVVLQFAFYFTLRFLPSLIVCLVCFGITLHSYCEADVTQSDCRSWYATSSASNDSYWNNWYSDSTSGHVIAQNILLFQLVLYFVCICMSFVHRSDHIWRKPPYTNWLWLVITPVLLILHVIFCVADAVINDSSAYLSTIHLAVWVIVTCWPVIIVVANELIKHHENKLYVRFQKRARLNFGTKLGMNSPF